jgi:hypothetical protein
MIYEIGQRVTQLQILELLIAFWPYKKKVDNFNLIVMPWLEAIAGKNF